MAAATPLVVRTSQSGIIPDTPGPLPEISGLIPHTEIDPTFKVKQKYMTMTIFKFQVSDVKNVMCSCSFFIYCQAWLTGSHNRTTKSGILVENPISRVEAAVEDDVSSPEPSVSEDQEEESGAK